MRSCRLSSSHAPRQQAFLGFSGLQLLFPSIFLELGALSCTEEEVDEEVTGGTELCLWWCYL
jgi:hypothetical protein